MSAIVNYEWYSTEYMGTEADSASFPALCAHASRMIGLLTRWQATEETFQSLDAYTQQLVRLALCAEIDYLAINGVEVMNGNGDGGFTVGKVSVQAKAASGNAGAMSGKFSPATIGYLEQTGLMYPGAGVAQC